MSQHPVGDSVDDHPDSVRKFVMLCYGEQSETLNALLNNAEFKGLVKDLYGDGSAPIPDPRPQCFDEALETDALRVDGDRYGAGSRMVVIPAEAESLYAERLRPILGAYVGIIEEAAEEMEAAYEDTSVSQHFSWDESVHTMVAGLVIDLAMGHEMISAGHIARRPDQGSVIWSFEQISAGNGFGAQVLGASNPRIHFTQLWHLTVERQALRMGPTIVDHLVAVATGAEAEKKPKEELYLRHLGLLKTVDGALQPTFPVFHAADTERLTAPLKDAARELVEYAIVPGIEALAGLDWWKDRYEDEAYRHAAVRLLLEYGVDKTIESGVLPQFPKGRPETSWGRFLWIESDSSEDSLILVAESE